VILCGKAAVCWFLWFAGAAAALAQQAPVDTLPGSPPVESQAVRSDTLVCDGAAVTGPEPAAPVRGTPILGNERFTTRRLVLELASGSLGEAVFMIPGVHIVKAGWHGLPQTLNLRGTRARDNVYLLDGVPFSDNQLEDFDLNYVPLAAIETCEIAKGGLSSVHGSGAIAGVLGLRSVTAMPEFPESEIGAWWGSFDSREVSLRFNRRITERLGILGTYENLGSGGWIDDSSAETERLLGKGTALLGGATRVDLTGYRYRGDFEWPDSCPGVFSTYPADQKNERSLLGASIVSGERRRVYIRYYRLGTSESYSSAGTTYVDDGLLQGAELGVSWPGPDSARTVLGAGFESRRLESSSLGDRTSTDFYLHALRERRSERSTIQGSIRLAKNSAFDAEVAGGLAARYSPREGIFLFSRLDRSYSFPSFDVLYSGGKDRPADSRIGTETSWGLELGAAIERGSLSASLSAFGRNTAGLALWVSDDSCRAYLDPGVEISVIGFETSLGVCVQPWFETELSYCVIRAHDGAGVKPAYIPQQTVTALVRVRKRLSRHISAGMAFAGRYAPPMEVGPRLDPCAGNAACLTDAELPGCMSAMLNTYFDIDRATIFFKIQNLANDSITMAWGRPELPSRSYEFGTSWRLLD
jgi:outer membrane receptor protein involved in Fe transport